MMPAATHDLIAAYYAAFNAADADLFLSLLSTDVEHDISQGDRQTGRDAFARFLDHMNHCYREQITDLVIMTNADGSRAAAEFVVHGCYIATDPGLPADVAPARGQSYTLPAGAFFAIRDGRIARISNHYNLADWIRQIA